MSRTKQIIETMAAYLYRARGYYRVAINGTTFKTDPYHVGFWRKASIGAWEPETFRILSMHLDGTSVYCDVGAWIGPTVLYAAKRCKKVICFEPDPVAYRYLSWNLELNELSNVSCYNIALAEATAIRKMSSFRSIGDSGTSLLDPQAGKGGIDVLTLAWSFFLRLSGIEKVSLMKIDIEGGEFALMPSLREYLAEYRPIVYLSTHAPFLVAGERRQRMSELADVMRVYGKCLDARMVPMNVNELVSSDACEEFRSYLFME